MQRDVGAYLRDILDACAAIEDVLLGLEFHSDRGNCMVCLAVERECEELLESLPGDA